MSYRKHNPKMTGFIKGFLVESYIEDGAQKIGEGIYGKSITDACLGWSKTEELIGELSEY
jgi:3-deoxy-7-phosphoheptulonate synthase